MGLLSVYKAIIEFRFCPFAPVSGLPYRTHLVVPSVTVNDLKRIYDLENHDVPLTFRGQPLDDDKSLGFYGIPHEATIEYR